MTLLKGIPQSRMSIGGLKSEEEARRIYDLLNIARHVMHGLSTHQGRYNFPIGHYNLLMRALKDCSSMEELEDWLSTLGPNGKLVVGKAAAKAAGSGRQQARRPNPATSAQRQAPQPAAAAVQQRPLMKRKREHAAAAEEGSTAPVAVNLLDARADGAGQGTRQAGPGPAPAAPSPAAPSAAAALPAHVGDPWVALDRIKPLLRAVGVTAKEESDFCRRYGYDASAAERHVI